MTEQLTGYEASSVAEIEAILDAMPADADTVYLDTIGYSERAIAAVAAKRAGSGGSSFNGGTITNELRVAPDHDSGSGTVALVSHGDDWPTRMLSIFSLHGGPHLVLSVEESGRITVASGDLRNADGSWTFVPDNGTDVSTNIIDVRKPDGGGSTIWFDGTGSSEQTLSVGATATIRDHTGAHLFEVREDGSVHIKTGTTIQADL